MLANTQATRDGAEIVFAYYLRNQTGLYALNTATGGLREIVRPQPGLLTDPCLARDGRTVFCLYAPNAGRTYVAAASVRDTAFARLFEVPRDTYKLALAERAQRFYLAVAGDVGHSSPLARDAPQLWELYSVATDGTGLRRESQLGAYTLWGRLALDANEECLYFGVTFLHHARPATRPNGPYRYRVASHELTYLLPQNFNALHPKMGFSLQRDTVGELVLSPCWRNQSLEGGLTGLG